MDRELEAIIIGDIEPIGEVELLLHWSARVLTGDAETASGSMDLDYAHDRLAAAARRYLGGA